MVTLYKLYKLVLCYLVVPHLTSTERKHEVWSPQDKGPWPHYKNQPCAIQQSLCSHHINPYHTKIVSVCANKIKSINQPLCHLQMLTFIKIYNYQYILYLSIQNANEASYEDKGPRESRGQAECSIHLSLFSLKHKRVFSQIISENSLNVYIV